MKISLTSHRFNIIMLFLLMLFGVGSFTYNQFLLDRILKKERSSVRLWAKAVEFAGNSDQKKSSGKVAMATRQLQLNVTVPDSVVEAIESLQNRQTSDNFVAQEIILRDQFKIPAIIADETGKILYGNHISGDLNRKQLQRLAAYHQPIKISFGTAEDAHVQYIYYGESPTVRYLRYFPYIQIGLLALVLGMAFVSYRTISRSEQSNILVGMTKEAAHQLGTPLSSMYGWIGLLRDKYPNDDFIARAATGLENDVTRLQGIAERFNKIGSEPELSSTRLKPHIKVVLNYMERRVPKLGKKVEIRTSIEENIQARINPELFEWALENIIKNAMNAIKIKKRGAFVAVTVKQVGQKVQIDVKDSGRGIEKKYFKEIFKPGYSTKKRGWGLGLSLTKRIIEEYHKGEIFVLDSEVGRGTTFRMILPSNLKNKA